MNYSGPPTIIISVARNKKKKAQLAAQEKHFYVFRETVSKDAEIVELPTKVIVANETAVGPFKNRLCADWFLSHGMFNPHIQCAFDAEELFSKLIELGIKNNAVP